MALATSAFAFFIHTCGILISEYFSTLEQPQSIHFNLISLQVREACSVVWLELELSSHKDPGPSNFTLTSCSLQAAAHISWPQCSHDPLPNCTASGRVVGSSGIKPSNTVVSGQTLFLIMVSRAVRRRNGIFYFEYVWKCTVVFWRKYRLFFLNTGFVGPEIDTGSQSVHRSLVSVNQTG